MWPLLSQAAPRYRSATKGTLWLAGSVWARHAPRQRCVKSHMGRVDGAVHHVIRQDDELADTALRGAVIFVIFIEPDFKQLLLPVQNSTTTNTLRWRHTFLHLKTFLESTNINYLYEKSMDSSVIDQTEADSKTDVFEEKEMIAFAPAAHLKNSMPKISIRGNADVQTWRVNIPEDHSLSGWLLHIITCRRKSHYSRAWSLCEGQNSNYGSGWIKTLTRALIKHIWAGVNGAIEPTGTPWKGLTNPKPFCRSRSWLTICTAGHVETPRL